MHVPRELYPIERALAEHLPHLRGPQRRGLALWVLGAVLAQSACQAAVLAALLPWAPYHALRQRLREWLLDGVDKAVLCAAPGMYSCTIRVSVVGEPWSADRCM